MNNTIILPKFRNAAGFKKAGCSGKWSDDCREVSRLAAELRENEIPVRVVLIDGTKYVEFLKKSGKEDSTASRKAFAVERLKNRKYKMSPAALTARRKSGKLGGRPRKKPWLTKKEQAILAFDPEPLIEAVCEYAVKNFKSPVFNLVGDIYSIDEMVEHIRIWAKSDLADVCDGNADALFEFYINKLEEKA